MKILFKIIKYQLHDLLRSKWFLLYTLFYFVMNYGMLSFTNDVPKMLISLMNVILIIIPLISLVFGTIYYYNNREYVIFMLSQPIDRKTIFTGLFTGLSIPLSLSLILGVFSSVIFYPAKFSGYFPTLFLIVLTGVILTFIFTAISFYISTKNEDKLKGFGLTLFVWLFLTILVDGLLMFVLQYFHDYPLETFSLIAIMFNPIDLARVIIMLKFDVSALMGYTGAVFQHFFGNYTGMIISFFVLIFWAIITLFFGLRKFSRKDF